MIADNVMLAFAQRWVSVSKIFFCARMPMMPGVIVTYALAVSAVLVGHEVALLPAQIILDAII